MTCDVARGDESALLNNVNPGHEDLVVAPLNSRWYQWTEKVAFWATILCAIDCTVLPVLSALTPALSALSSLHEDEHTRLHAHGGFNLHDVTTALTVYFVVPLALLVSIINFSRHRSIPTFLWGATSAAVLGLAHLFHGFSGHWQHHFVAVIAAASLLGCNYFTHKFLLDGCCGHDHHEGGAKTYPINPIKLRHTSLSGATRDELQEEPSDQHHRST